MKSTHSILLTIGMWAAIICFALRCLISISTLREGCSAYTLFGYASEAVGIAALIVLAYDKLLWRYLPFCVVPVLKSCYTGTMKSCYDQKVREVSIVIKQTFSEINVIFKTVESKGTSVSAAFKEINGERKLVYTYFNTPNSEHRGRSPLHIGTTILSIENINQLTGQYYTDRKTTGDISVKAIDKK